MSELAQKTEEEYEQRERELSAAAKRGEDLRRALSLKCVERLRVEDVQDVLLELVLGHHANTFKKNSMS